MSHPHRAAGREHHTATTRRAQPMPSMPRSECRLCCVQRVPERPSVQDVSHIRAHAPQEPLHDALPTLREPSDTPIAGQPVNGAIVDHQFWVQHSPLVPENSAIARHGSPKRLRVEARGYRSFIAEPADTREWPARTYRKSGRITCGCSSRLSFSLSSGMPNSRITSPAPSFKPAHPG